MTFAMEKRLFRLLALATLSAWAVADVLMISSCASTPSAVPTPSVKIACLPLKGYSQAQDQAVAAELAKLAPDDPVAAFIVDYGQMRAADRACLAQAQ